MAGALITIRWLLFIIGAIYLPGLWLCSKLRFGGLPWPVILGTGWCLWGLMLFSLSWLGLADFLTVFWIYTAVWYIRRRRALSAYRFAISPAVGILLFFGLICQLLPVVSSGMSTSAGLEFYHINSTDGIYYLALSRSFERSFPPAEPGVWGHLLKNYHYFSALLLNYAHHLTGISLEDLHFRLVPLTLSLTLGLLFYNLSLLIFSSYLSGWLALFLFYFGSDLGYLIMAIFFHIWDPGGLQAIDRSPLLFTNIPRALSFVPLFTGWYLLLKSKITPRLLRLSIAGILLITALGYKIHTGILSALILLIYCLRHFLATRRLIFLAVGLPALLLAGVIYFPANSAAGGLIWSPFTWPRHFAASTALSVLNWPIRERIFLDHQNWPRLILLYGQYLLVYLIAVYGTRLVGLLGLISSKLPHREYFMVSVLVFSILGLFFLQASGPFESFNFLSSLSPLLCLLTAWILAQAYSQKLWGALLITLILLATLPRPILDSLHFIQGRDKFIITPPILAATAYFSGTPLSTVIYVWPTYLPDQQTPIIEYLSGRSTFYSGQSILAAHNRQFPLRERQVQQLVFQKTQVDKLNFCHQLGINYVFVSPPADIFPKEALVFRNSAAEIIRCL